MKKVMLADDDEYVLTLLHATLENNDRYELLMARDGKEALAIARRELPDLIFLDIKMPYIDGYEICRALKKDPATSQAKVIMLTGLTRESDRKKAQEAGTDDFIAKPFSPTMLLEKINTLLDVS